MADGDGAVATTWLQRLAPDLADTVRRFPFAIVLAALATTTFLYGSNVVPDGDSETWMRIFLGFATAAVCAVAGVFFVEGGPRSRVVGMLLAYGVPVVGIAVFQIRDAGWVVPFTLPAVSVLWLSVAAFTRVEPRGEQQHRFWWINQRAASTAALAALAFAVIAIGILAVERSLSVLFGLESGDLFLAPVYWLSTLPRLTDYQAAEMERPEFIAGAVGFLGQFVLAPFLVVYSAILLVYTAQIAVSWRLPEGTIGWMVLGYVVAGAATWLLLHPPFMSRRPVVRLFRRAWFWLTLVPLALFFLAVWVRVDAYGLTSERLLLATGGVWAAVLSIAFLVGRGDIRLIPALAGAILLVFSFGPWNYLAWPNYDQGVRLSRLLALTSDETVTVSTPDWTPEQAAQARGAILYLHGSDHGRLTLSGVLLDHGILYDPAADKPYDLLAELGYPETAPRAGEITTVSRDIAVPIDVSSTPFYVGRQDVWETDPSGVGLELSLEAGALEVYREGALILSQPLAAWAARQRTDGLAEPWIDFTAEGMAYRLVLTTASWREDSSAASDRRQVTGLMGVLFTNDRTASIPRRQGVDRPA